MAVVAKGTFAIREPDVISLLPAQEAVQCGDVHHGDPAASSVKYPSDLVMNKVATDVGIVLSTRGMDRILDIARLGRRPGSMMHVDQTVPSPSRIGLDLILPIAAMVPFERHVKWAAQKQLGTKVLAELLGGAGALFGREARGASGWVRLPGRRS